MVLINKNETNVPSDGILCSVTISTIKFEKLATIDEPVSQVNFSPDKHLSLCKTEGKANHWWVNRLGVDSDKALNKIIFIVVCERKIAIIIKWAAWRKTAAWLCIKWCLRVDEKPWDRPWSTKEERNYTQDATYPSIIL